MTFEKQVIQKVVKSLKKDKYSFKQTDIKGVCELIHQRKNLGLICRKDGFHQYLKSKEVMPEKLLGRTYRPSVAVVQKNQKILYIVDIKSQRMAGTTDEKLLACDFKKSQYQILADELGLRGAEYIYVLNSSWFLQNHERYREVFKYIRKVGCDYLFDKFPLTQMGLPDSQDEV